MGSKTTIKGNRNTPVEIIGSNNTFIIAANAKVTVSGDEGAVFSHAGDEKNRLVVSGSVTYLSESGIGAIDFGSSASSITIAANGEVTGPQGIQISGAHTKVDNAGVIQASSNGIEAAVRFGAIVDAEIHNSGSISAYNGVFLGGTGTITNEKGGKIDGSGYGVWVAGTEVTVINHGVISGDDSGLRSDCLLKLVNHGTLKGGILSTVDDTDTVDNRGGKITGGIELGAGEDILITDKASDKLIEADDGDYDTVKSTASYTLNENVERLYLLGGKNIDGTGTAGDNLLLGNKGNNTLDGKGGFDEIYGFGGKDVLIGGSGTDMFGFAKGWGRDTVKNFTQGVDHIDIYDMGPASFEELQPHLKTHGDDTWISFGKDVMIVKDVILGEDDVYYDLHW